MDSLDVPGRFWDLPQPFPQLRNLARQSILSNKGSTPNLVENLIFFDQPARILNQKEEQGKCFRLELNGLARLEHPEVCRFDPNVVEEKNAGILATHKSVIKPSAFPQDQRCAHSYSPRRAENLSPKEPNPLRSTGETS